MGMTCPCCGVWASVKETRTRKTDSVVTRRYECGNMHRFSTEERIKVAKTGVKVQRVKVQRVKLVGGTRDGTLWDVYSYQSRIYLQKRHCWKDILALHINARISWKAPEEVYERQPDGRFQYQHTVHYKPDDAVSDAMNANPLDSRELQSKSQS